MLASAEPYARLASSRPLLRKLTRQQRQDMPSRSKRRCQVGGVAQGRRGQSRYTSKGTRGEDLR
jgi:hypothetical protein